MDILQSKLQPPSLTNTLYRARLYRDFTRNKLIKITAGAGYGKTTLAVDALTRLEVATIWYRLDSQDTDFRVFMAYLKAGLGRLHRGLGCQAPLEAAGKSALRPQAEFLLAFISLLEKWTDRDTVLVLDDFHRVQENPEIIAGLEFLLERLPEKLHVVLISRKEPPLRISRLRVDNQLLEIDETDLAFTADETGAYCRKAFGLPVTEALAAQMHAKTGGWAASLVLFGCALKGKPSAEIEKHLSRYTGSQSHIFAYLEENVFAALPPERKSFMLKAALFEAIDIRLCNRVMQIDNAGEMVRQLVNDHLLTYPVVDDPTIFYFHHLLRDYLLAKLKQTYSRSQVDHLHRRIAAAMEPIDVFQALHHHIAGHDFEAAVRVIETHEIKFLLAGKIHFLQQCMRKIPAGDIQRNPQLLFVQAKLYSFYGKPQDAILKLKAAHQLFREKQSVDDMVKCLVDLGSQYYFTGHVREAKLLMEQVLGEVPEQSPTYIIAMTYLVFLSAVLGELASAESYARQAREVIAGYPEFERQVAATLIDTSCTYVHFISGDFESSRRLNRKLRKTATDLKIEACLPLAYYQSAATSCFLGAYEKGYDFAQAGIRICEKIDLQDSQKGWVYVAWAQNCLGLHRLDEARRHIERSMTIFEAPGNRWGLANACDCLHQLYLRQDNLPRAKKMLVRALALIEGYGLPLTEGILENGMAHIRILESRFADALTILDRARDKLAGAAFYLFENYLLSVHCCVRTKRRRPAVTYLARGLDLSAEKNFDRFIKDRQAWLVPLAKDNRLAAHQRAYLSRLFKPGARQVPALTLHLLGRFQAKVGDRDIDAAVLNNSKSRTILKYLAAHRASGFIPREVLIELLWPEEDFRKTGKRFNVAMSALRKALEPDLEPRAPSTYIRRRKDAYRLCGHDCVRVDVDAFRDALNRAEHLKNEDPVAAAAHYRTAEACYRGDFLEESPYADWCIPERQRLQAARMGILESLLEIHAAAGDHENCIAYAEKIIQSDPCHEAAFRGMMSAHASLGNTARVKRAYGHCIRNAAEIDCPVSPKTKALYKRLVAT